MSRCRKPEAEVESLEAEGAIDDARWRQVYERCRALPFDEYASIFDPHGDQADETVTGSLADDLADIYRDVGDAVAAFDAGRPTCARWELTEGRGIHWGRHATGAIRALDTFLADGRGSTARRRATTPLSRCRPTCTSAWIDADGDPAETARRRGARARRVGGRYRLGDVATPRISAMTTPHDAGAAGLALEFDGTGSALYVR
ncbi:MAG: DUF5063 domain-containing protein, partial [Planctomycetia bacterium]|nr:DUF5063 domain-containing protein [Planctomycetia bacterium]